jgi:hypothetical protein
MRNYYMSHGKPLTTVSLARSFEAFFEIIFKLIGIALTYILLNGVLIIIFKADGLNLLTNSYGLLLINKEYQSEDLFNLLIFPVLYVLRDSYKIAEPFYINAYMTNSDITVVSGILTRTTDKLRIENLENIELVKTPMGRWNLGIWKKYGTLNLHAFGGLVVIPYLASPETEQLEIEKNLDNIKAKTTKTSTN